MKKLTSIIAILILGAGSIFAQNAFVGGHRAWTFAVQGGMLYSLNENCFTYRDNGEGLKLFTPQGSAAIGYEFTNALGARLSVGYGLNRSAGNHYQTAAFGYYPYSFKSINAFLDATLDLNGNFEVERAFRPVFYLGIGLGHTFGFTESHHPWQQISPKNNAFGFRGGFIAEFDFTQSFGFFIDLGGEAYTDNYNGLRPAREDQQGYRGYAGFPLDLRFMGSFGLIYRFNY